MPISDDITIRLNIDFGGATRDLGELSGAVNRLAEDLGQAKSEAGGLLEALQGIASTISSISSSRLEIITSQQVEMLERASTGLSAIQSQQAAIGNIGFGGGGGGAFGGGAFGGGGGYGGGYSGGGAAAIPPVGDYLNQMGSGGPGAGGALVSTLMASLGIIQGFGSRGIDWIQNYSELYQMGGGLGAGDYNPLTGGVASTYGPHNRVARLGTQALMMGGLSQGFSPDDTMRFYQQGLAAGGVRAVATREADSRGGDTVRSGMEYARTLAMDAGLIVTIMSTVQSATGMDPRGFMGAAIDAVRQSGRVGQQSAIIQELAQIVTGMREIRGPVTEAYNERIMSNYAAALRGGATMGEANRSIQGAIPGPQNPIEQYMAYDYLINELGMDPQEAMLAATTRYELYKPAVTKHTAGKIGAGYDEKSERILTKSVAQTMLAETMGMFYDSGSLALPTPVRTSQGNFAVRDLQYMSPKDQLYYNDPKMGAFTQNAYGGALTGVTLGAPALVQEFTNWSKDNLKTYTDLAASLTSLAMTTQTLSLKIVEGVVTFFQKFSALIDAVIKGVATGDMSGVEAQMKSLKTDLSDMQGTITGTIKTFGGVGSQTTSFSNIAPSTGKATNQSVGGQPIWDMNAQPSLGTGQSQGPGASTPTNPTPYDNFAVPVPQSSLETNPKPERFAAILRGIPKTITQNTGLEQREAKSPSGQIGGGLEKSGTIVGALNFHFNLVSQYA